MFEILDVEAVRWVTAALATDPGCPDDGARVAEIRALEELKCAAEARQAALTVGLAESRATALEVALARRESHHRGRRHLGLARIVSQELPHTWAAWRAGRVSQWRAALVARETSCLTLADRRRVDAELAGVLARLEAMGDRELVGCCRPGPPRWTRPRWSPAAASRRPSAGSRSARLRTRWST